MTEDQKPTDVIEFLVEATRNPVLLNEFRSAETPDDMRRVVEAVMDDKAVPSQEKIEELLNAKNDLSDFINAVPDDGRDKY